MIKNKQNTGFFHELGIVLILVMTFTAGSTWGNDEKLQYHPVFEQMKTYRTYFSIEKYTPLRHNFYIWFERGGFGTSLQAAANTVDEATTLEHFISGFQAGYLELPDPLPGKAVPDELTPVADAIIERIKAKFKETDKFVIRLMGQYYNMRLKEIIPEDTAKNMARRRAFIGEWDVKVKQDLSKIEANFGYAGSGSTILCTTYEPERCATLPQFVDFSMPLGMEGTSILSSEFFSEFHPEADIRYQKAWAQFEKKLLTTVKQLSDESYNNPIERILARQGSTVLPIGFTQDLEFDINIYGYPKEEGRTVSEHYTIRFKTKDLVQKGYHQKHTIEKLGIDLDVKMDWDKEVIELGAEHQSGVSGSLSLTMKTDRLLVDGPRMAIRHYISVEGKDESMESTQIRLKDVPPYREILVSADNSIRNASEHSPETTAPVSICCQKRRYRCGLLQRIRTHRCFLPRLRRGIFCRQLRRCR